MGRDLFRTSAVFRASITELDKVYKAATGSSLIELGLFTETAADAKDPLGDPWPIAITLPALTMLQLALVETLAATLLHPLEAEDQIHGELDAESMVCLQDVQPTHNRSLVIRGATPVHSVAFLVVMHLEWLSIPAIAELGLVCTEL